MKTAKLVRQAANKLGGAPALAKHMNVGQALVNAFINGKEVPNAPTIAALEAIVDGPKMEAV
jgi:hypothetical protein